MKTGCARVFVPPTFLLQRRKLLFVRLSHYSNLGTWHTPHDRGAFSLLGVSRENPNDTRIIANGGLFSMEDRFVS